MMEVCKAWTAVLPQRRVQRRGCADSGRSRDRYRTAGVDPTATLAARVRGVRYL